MGLAILISLDIKIPHLKIAPLVGNLEVGNLEGIPSFRIISSESVCSAINISAKKVFLVQ